mmetsp:Transcript_43929/g.110733  ORF Transcript_43929/g.110733 Transcript_43929/m.110733 type:complete len:201 (-) Transcript_43929:74-676(-)
MWPPGAASRMRGRATRRWCTCFSARVQIQQAWTMWGGRAFTWQPTRQARQCTACLLATCPRSRSPVPIQKGSPSRPTRPPSTATPSCTLLRDFAATRPLRKSSSTPCLPAAPTWMPPTAATRRPLCLPAATGTLPWPSCSLRTARASTWTSPRRAAPSTQAARCTGRPCSRTTRSWRCCWMRARMRPSAGRWAARATSPW